MRIRRSWSRFRRTVVRPLTRLSAAGALVSAVGFTGCTDTGDTEPTPVVENSVGLHAFQGCEPLLDYFQEEAISLVEALGELDEPIAIGAPGEALGAPDRANDEAGGQANGPEAGNDGAAPSFSGTNVQESGVDEPDLVKTDGRHLYVVRNGYLLIYDAADLTETSRVELPGYGGELLVAGDTAVVLGQTWGAPEEPFEGAPAHRLEAGSKGVVSVYDISDRAAPSLVRRTYVDGALRTARLVNGTVRIVVQSEPTEWLGNDPRFDIDGPPSAGGGTSPGRPAEGSSAGGSAGGDGAGPDGGDTDGAGEDEPPVDEGRFAQEADWMAQVRALIESTTIDDWMPLAYDAVGDTTEVRRLVTCERVHRPGERAGFGLTAVLSIDLDDPTAAVADPAVVTSASVVYASADALYITTPNDAGIMRAVDDVAEPAVVDVAEGPAEGSDAEEGAGGDDADGAGAEGRIGSRAFGQVAEDDREATQVHKLSIADADSPASYVASGRVFGTPLNSFSLGEHDGHLRIATTEQERGGEWTTVNHLFVLGEADDGLAVTGEVTGIAPTERIYSARFMAERGFMVTFRQIDPLFTLDLSDPTAPAVIGELKVPGFSTYLHPLGAEHLIGIGQAADEEGRVEGMQLSLFDVSDFANPALDHTAPLGEGWSQALYDHHAFAFWAPESLLMIPVETWENDGAEPRMGVELFRVDPETGFMGSGFISHADLAPEGWWGGRVERNVVIGDAIFSVSDLGIKVNGIDDLAERARATFPEARDGGPRDGGWGGAEPAPAPEPAEDDDAT